MATGRTKTLDRELALLLGGFGLLWVLVGGAGYSLLPYGQCVNQKFGDIKAACDKALQSPLVKGPLRISALQAKLDQLIANGDHQGTITTVDDLLMEGERSSRLYVNKAWAQKQLGKLDQALEDYRTAMGVDPNDEEVFGSLMRTLVEIKRFDSAREEAVIFSRTNPKAAIAPEWLGWIEREQRNYGSALQHYRNALILAPEDAWLRNEIGAMLEQSGANEEALASYGKAIEFDEYSSEYKRARALLLATLGRHTDAQADLINALQYERDQSTILALAQSYIDDRKLNLAEPLVVEAIGNDSKDESALVMRIRLLYWQNKLGQTQIAIRDLRAVNPKSADAIYWTAIVDETLGNKHAAVLGYRSILHDRSNESALRVDLGHLLIDLSNSREALKVFNVAVALAPNVYHTYSGRARANRMLQRYQDCIDDANKSLSLFARNGATLGNRAFAEWKLGDIAAARKDYLAAQFLRPDITWVRTELIELLIEQKLFDHANAEIEAALRDKIDGSAIGKLRRQLELAQAAKS